MRGNNSGTENSSNYSGWYSDLKRYIEISQISTNSVHGHSMEVKFCALKSPRRFERAALGVMPQQQSHSLTQSS